MLHMPKIFDRDTAREPMTQYEHGARYDGDDAEARNALAMQKMRAGDPAAARALLGRAVAV